MADRANALRVLSVAHAGVTRSGGRLRYGPLAAEPGLALRLVVPRRWHEFGRRYEFDGDAGADGLDVRALPVWLPRAGPAHWYLHHYPGLGQQARAFRPDVIHLWEEPWSVVALQGASLARRLGAALVLEVDQNILKRLPPPFEQLRRFVLRQTDLLLVRSKAAAEVARRCGYAGPTMPIGYGVDEDTFFPGPRAPDGRALRLGYVGRLVPEKGVDDLIDALAALPAGAGAPCLTIMGDGPHGAALRARADAAGLAGRVTFRRWDRPEAVAALLRDIDALALPTRTTANVREQFGRVIIEAQACGTPVIGTTSGAIADVVGAGGWVVPQGDPAALAALLSRLQGAPDERRRRAAAGLANVAARFTVGAVAQDLLRAWRRAHAARVAPGEGEAAPRQRALAGAGPR